jgi:GNAT superfamily N-acetyltransferase
VLDPSLKNFIRLANLGGHQLLYHPASILDIKRDSNISRRNETLNRIGQYIQLESPPVNPINGSNTSPNDWCDNDIYYALECSAVHALVTEDRQIHKKAKLAGIGHKVYYIQTAEDWLRRLIPENSTINLPNIENVFLYNLTEQLDSEFFNSLRNNYDFNEWFRKTAQSGRQAWISRSENGQVDAICIYAKQTDETINDDGDRLSGSALKLCTFKVSERIRGRKIGELFLKAAFRYATENSCENIFITTRTDQEHLLGLLSDFGFFPKGTHKEDIVLVKAHPQQAPQIDLPAIDYVKKYFPHYRNDNSIQKFLVPIQPQFHKILFPDFERQTQLFENGSAVGNAIKLAYLCNAPSNQVRVGDVVLFYRSKDEMAITSIGVVEVYETHTNPTIIMQLVSRRTVYSQTQIESMADSPVRVMLFRLIGHFHSPISRRRLIHNNIVADKFMSITKISNDSFSRLLELS